MLTPRRWFCARIGALGAVCVAGRGAYCASMEDAVSPAEARAMFESRSLEGPAMLSTEPLRPRGTSSSSSSVLRSRPSTERETIGRPPTSTPRCAVRRSELSGPPSRLPSEVRGPVLIVLIEEKASIDEAFEGRFCRPIDP